MAGSTDQQLNFTSAFNCLQKLFIALCTPPRQHYLLNKHVVPGWQGRGAYQVAEINTEDSELYLGSPFSPTGRGPLDCFSEAGATRCVDSRVGSHSDHSSGVVKVATQVISFLLVDILGSVWSVLG